MQYRSIFNLFRHWMGRAFLPMLLIAASVGIGACANQDGSRGNPGVDSQQPVSEDSPEFELRRRAALRLELAVAYLEQGKPEVALDEVNQALAIDPRYSDAVVLRGLVYYRMGDLASAEQSYQRALTMGGADGGAFHNLGLLRCQQQRFKEAESLFRRALSAPRYKEPATSWLALGVCQLRAGAVADAEASLLHAFEFDPGNPITAYNLGKLQYDKKDYARARFYIGRLNAQDLANAESLFLGILIERRLSNADGARAYIDQLRKRFPNSLQLAKVERGEMND
jgi:type IV pilus assembly protein PilF